MIFLRKNCLNQFIRGCGALIVWVVVFGCSGQRTVLQSVYQVEGCSTTPSSGRVADEMVKRGYLQFSEKKGAAAIFHRPRIEKSGMFASEPYIDRSGEIAVAVCTPARIVAVSESRSCARTSECTAGDQKEVGRALESLGCKITAGTDRTPSWELETRSDWNDESCGRLVADFGMKELLK